MAAKNTRREQAIKRDKRKKLIIIIVCVVAAAAIIAALAVNAHQRRGVRVFSAPNQTVELHTDGTFSAVLHHNIRRRGTFTESTSDGITTITFIEGNMSAVGSIEGDILTIPAEWDDGHRHNRFLTQTR